MPGSALATTIGEYERIEEMLGRLMSYAQLLFSGDSTNAEVGRFYQTVSERVTTISSHLLFFSLELNRLDEAALEQKLAEPALARWRAGELHAAGDRTPILMLTARDSVEDASRAGPRRGRLHGEAVRLGELLARLRALLRRTRPAGDDAPLWFAGLSLTGGRGGLPRRACLRVDAPEYALLEVPAQPRQVLTRN